MILKNTYFIGEHVAWGATPWCPAGAGLTRRHFTDPAGQ